MKIYKVGKNKEYSKVQEVLFLKGKENLIIEIDEGAYSEYIDLEKAKNVQIIGKGKVSVFSSKKESIINILNASNISIENLNIKNIIEKKDFSASINLNYSNNVEIKNCIIHDSNNTGIRIFQSQNVKLINSLIINNFEGINVSYSKIDFINNSVIKNRKFNLKFYISEANLEKNIFSMSKEGIRISKISGNKKDTELKIKSKKNLCFENEENIIDGKIENIFENKLNFLNVRKNDFRLRDKKFKSFGVNEEILLKWKQEFSQISIEKNDVNPEIKLSFFLNFSLKRLLIEYKSILKEQFRIWGLRNINFIESEFDLKDENTDVLFILNAFDTLHEKTISKIINRCQKINKSIYCYLPSANFNTTPAKMNLHKMVEVLENQNFLKQSLPKQIIYYANYDELLNSIHNKIPKRNSQIILGKLELKNISRFSNLTLNFDEKFLCLLSYDGLGKTSILRAIALAITGINHFDENEKKLIAYEMLRVTGVNRHGFFQTENGHIKLFYTINRVKYQNYLKFVVKDNGSVEVLSNSDFSAVDGSILKSLVIGFPKITNQNFVSNSKEIIQNSAVNLPHLNDLYNLTLNKNDKRVEHFCNWLAFLEHNAEYEERNRASNFLEDKKENEKEVKERKLINFIFEIASEIAEEEISFKSFKRQNHNDIWINTSSYKDGIRLSFAGLHYQNLLSFIGIFMKRMMEAYPDIDDFMNQPAVILIDEINAFLPPVFQFNLLKVLRRKFKNTQFIVASNSPLVVENLGKNQLLHLIEDGRNVQIEYNEKDIWEWNKEKLSTDFFQIETDYSSIDTNQLEIELEKMKENEADEYKILEMEKLLEHIYKIEK